MSRLIILMNIGSPSAPTWPAVARYLGEFLTDPRMLNMPWPLRYGLVYGLIVPTRTRTSSEAYKKVWSERGAPLVRFSEDLRAAVQARLPQDIVRIGMRYGQSYRVKTALLEAKNIGVREVIALPLFPQFSEAATASAMAELYDVMAAIKFKVPVKTKQDFYDHPGFIAAQAKLVEAKRTALQPDHILMSYHGLPENHVQATDQSGLHCLKSAQCCERIVAANGRCYRAQSFATSRALATALNLKPTDYSVSFQSRLGRTPWIRPFTDEIIHDLRKKGVKRLLVVCPSFVADCLETLEEIGMRCQEDWMSLGGEAFDLTPCVNASPQFVDTTLSLIEEAN